MLERLLRGTRGLVRKALSEHASPGEIGLAVAIGTFCSCTPFIGFHIWMALGLATLLRLSRLWAAVGSRATMGLWPLVVFVEIELAHRARVGVWAPISPREAVAHGSELLLDWGLGTVAVGGVYALLLGALAYGIARQLPRSRPLSDGVTSSGTPGERRPASSGSPPSAPPSPTP